MTEQGPISVLKQRELVKVEKDLSEAIDCQMYADGDNSAADYSSPISSNHGPISEELVEWDAAIEQKDIKERTDDYQNYEIADSLSSDEKELVEWDAAIEQKDIKERTDDYQNYEIVDSLSSDEISVDLEKNATETQNEIEKLEEQYRIELKRQEQFEQELQILLKEKLNKELEIKERKCSEMERFYHEQSKNRKEVYDKEYEKLVTINTNLEDERQKIAIASQQRFEDLEKHAAEKKNQLTFEIMKTQQQTREESLGTAARILTDIKDMEKHAAKQLFDMEEASRNEMEMMHAASKKELQETVKRKRKEQRECEEKVQKMIFESNEQIQRKQIESNEKHKKEITDLMQKNREDFEELQLENMMKLNELQLEAAIDAQKTISATEREVKLHEERRRKEIKHLLQHAK